MFGDECSIQTNIDYQEKSRIQEENDEPKNSELCLVKFCICLQCIFYWKGKIHYEVRFPNILCI